MCRTCDFYRYIHSNCLDAVFTIVLSLYEFKRITRLAARFHQFTAFIRYSPVFLICGTFFVQISSSETKMQCHYLPFYVLITLLFFLLKILSLFSYSFIYTNTLCLSRFTALLGLIFKNNT